MGFYFCGTADNYSQKDGLGNGFHKGSGIKILDPFSPMERILLKKPDTSYIIKKKPFEDVKMGQISLNAYAKINLSIDIVRKREDGYHDVKMIMQTVDLCDKITLTDKDDGGVKIICDKPYIPTGSTNTAYKAADLFLKEYGVKKGVCIKIEKNIPTASGLAGGSADAAAVLRGMGELFSVDTDEGELMEIGKKIGADVPFCIKGGTMLAEGIGDLLTKINPFSGVDIVLVKPRISVSTAWVYQNLNLHRAIKRPNTRLLVEAISNGDRVCVAQNMKNVLESVTIGKYRVINEIKSTLMEFGAQGSMMSGSGPCVFGIFENGQKAEYAFQKIKGGYWDCFLARTLC